jgi:sulfite oxidase
MKRPSWITGLLIGGLLTFALGALSAVGQAILNLPFFPAYLFAFGRDIAPGEIVPRTIQIMSNIIIGLNIGRVDEVAKTAEEVMAFLLFVAGGAVTGMIFFLVLNAVLKRRNDIIPGVILGVLLGIGLLLVIYRNPLLVRSEPAVTVIWVMGVMLLFGLALSYVYHTLRFRVRPTPAVSAEADAQAPGMMSVEGVDRRTFLLRVGGSAAVITVAGAGLSALLNSSQTAETAGVVSAPTVSPGVASTAEATVQAVTDGSFVPASGTRAKITPLAEHYRIDINSFIPEIPEEGYELPFTTKLTAGGSTQTLATLTLPEIRNNFEAVTVDLTMACISNRVAGDLIGTLAWTGARMSDILAEIEVPERATHLLITGVDGFDEYVSLDLINRDERILLAYDWAGQPLLPKHGFPLRIHIPNHFGMKQPKWITGMEFVSEDPGGYWVRRGWDERALVRTTSVIDTVAVSQTFEDEAGNTFVPVGGIAWSGDRGISRVALRLDDGDWQDAVLDEPDSDRTWVLWRYDLPFVAGSHTLEVIAYEGDGTEQITIPAGTFPSGATGLHSVNTTL